MVLLHYPGCCAFLEFGLYGEPLYQDIMLDKLLAAVLVVYTIIKAPGVIFRAARYANTKQFCTRPASEYIAIAAKLPIIIALTALITAAILLGVELIAYLFSLLP